MKSRRNRKLVSILMIALLLAGMLTGCTAKTQSTGSTANDKSSNSTLPKVSFANVSENTIDEDNIIGIIQELASEKYKGRKAGTVENEMAASYIADYFKKIGLENPKGLENYMQYYTQPLVDLKSAPTLNTVDAGGNTVTTFKYVENFALRSLKSNADSIDLKAPMYVVNSLTNLSPDNKDIKGKVVLISWKLRKNVNIASIIDEVYESGALGAICEYNSKGPDGQNKAQPLTPMIGAWLNKQYNPFVNIDSDSFAKLKEEAEKGMLIQYKCSYKIDLEKKVPNVIGLLPGTDPKLKDEYIIICSHFDHVGDNLNGTYNPGALDNASGTASIMEIAKVLKQSKVQPKKSILFLAFNGEEAGLLGSEYYATNPIYPLDKAIVIDLDMVGSSEKLPLTLIAYNANEIRQELEGYAKAIGLKAEVGYEDASDYLSFADQKVPGIMLINEDMDNGYHSPDDNMEDVSKDNLKQIVKLVLCYMDKNAY